MGPIVPPYHGSQTSQPTPPTGLAQGGPVITPPRDQAIGDRRYLKPEMIDDVFGYHPPSTPAVGDVHTLIRAELKRLAHWLNDLLPEGPLKTTAINGLRDTMWAANAAVATGQDPEWARRAERFLHYYDGGVVASFEAEQRELSRLGQWFLREGHGLLGEGNAVDNAIRLLQEYRDIAFAVGQATQEEVRATAHTWQPDPSADTGESDGQVLARLGTDADKWAAEFARRFGADHALMLGWFASAIMAGHDAGRAERGKRPGAEEAAQVVFEALGQAGIAWEQIPGAYQMEIAAAVGRDLLSRLGFQVPDRYLGAGGREAVAAAGLALRDELLGGNRALVDLTHRAYAAYGDTVDWKNYAGLPMPQWPDLGEKIQRAWLAAIGAAIEMYRAMVRLQIVEPGEPVMPVQVDPAPRFALAPVASEEHDDPVCGAETPDGPCALVAGHPTGPAYPGHNGHVSVKVPLPEEVGQRVDEFLEHPETGRTRERPQ